MMLAISSFSFSDSPWCPCTLGHHNLSPRTHPRNHRHKEQNFVLGFLVLKNLLPQSHRHFASRHDLIGRGHRAFQSLLFF